MERIRKNVLNVAVMFTMFGCMPKKLSATIGVVDVKNKEVCSVQLVDETTVIWKGDICNHLKEGDIIEVIRYDP